MASAYVSAAVHFQLVLLINRINFLLQSGKIIFCTPRLDSQLDDNKKLRKPFLPSADSFEIVLI